MQKSQVAVKNWMTLFGQPIPSKPGIPAEQMRLMRINTLAEELGELAQASGVELRLTAKPDEVRPVVEVKIAEGATPQLADVADALADLQYFVDGTAVAYGLDLEPFFGEVHRANMGKLWTLSQIPFMSSGWTAQSVCVSYGDDPLYVPPPGTCVPVQQKYIVKRPDGKVMKPPGFVPPQLKEILEAQNCRHESAVTDGALPGPTG